LLNFTLFKEWGKVGGKQQEFNTPSSVSCDENHIVIADTLNFRVQIFDYDGKFLQTINNKDYIYAVFVCPFNNFIYFLDSFPSCNISTVNSKFSKDHLLA